jgi:adenine-specific DNA-methyltransferase
MTELIWEGKYVDGKRQSPVRVALPFQTIETVNESAADRRRNLELFSTGRETEWRNRLICCGARGAVGVAITQPPA